MKKIFGFIGSPLKESSNTYTLTKIMLDKLVEMDGNIKYELITAGDVNINYCRGCWSCMIRGRCPQDNKDDMGSIKEKMIDSDFIIWGSPVYTMQVSGQMKTFMDRLAAWYHLMMLAGKPGLTAVTTSGGGMDEVHDFIGMLLCTIGVKVVGELGTYATLPKTFRDPDDAEKKAHEAANHVYPYLNGDKKVETDEYLEQSFQAMKFKVTMASDMLKSDYRYWEENGMLKLNSFDELLKKIQK